ncbi:hypothetical protein GWK08_10615 [Leptobacterium flavescens]|uniref:Uncharacterized protein n=1 Tax=Leptobacterium flavescens TaxID=472055 RepID=A0A6P0UKZ6_9FLAO|nr:hypothetical protein [Leptobacterium flavescens]NER13894.1 hypothetical protein [Leptobacterium flavescens]
MKKRNFSSVKLHLNKRVVSRLMLSKITGGATERRACVTNAQHECSAAC